MSNFGFKDIDAENWLEPDPVIRHFPGMQNQEDYVDAILAPRLSEKVPKDVQSLFEVARGALIYGYLFYPLYALATGQLFRVAEAAVAHKCTDLGIPKGQRKFQHRIDWLVERGEIPLDDAERWHALRRLRNSASHPTSQMILPPGMAVGILGTIAEDIKALFDNA